MFRKRDSFLVFGSPRIEEPEIQEVLATLRSGWLGTGPKVARFEEMFREYVGAHYALAVNSCTAALHLAMVATGIGPGDEVITTPMTFAATANSIIHALAHPVFVDVDRRTMNICPENIVRYIEDECVTDPKTGLPVNRRSRRKVRAIQPVHFAGRPCDMDAIGAIARKHRLYVIEDAAHAIETKYKGRKVGSIGDITCFSFYVTKNIVTGEGGMLTTNDEHIADQVKVLGLHGMSKDAWKRYSDSGFKHYQILFPGFKYNMMDIQASLGIHQIKRVDDYLKRRNEIWRRYDEAFADLPLELPAPPEPNTVHARHLYTPLLKLEKLRCTRDEFQQQLFELKIGTGIHFISLHLHDYYQRTYGYRPEDFPNARYISERTLSLPLSAKLTEDDVEDVIQAVRETIKGNAL
jgi:dTDP-4-amino-4,6-dideoxygalactose transaminase